MDLTIHEHIRLFGMDTNYTCMETPTFELIRLSRECQDACIFTWHTTKFVAMADFLFIAYTYLAVRGARISNVRGYAAVHAFEQQRSSRSPYVGLSESSLA